MATPDIPAKQPMMIELEAGTYFWCSCGKSAKQPFCDGAHAGTEFKPIQFTIEEKTKAAMCLCKHTGAKVYCDGTHRKL